MPGFSRPLAIGQLEAHARGARRLVERGRDPADRAGERLARPRAEGHVGALPDAHHRQVRLVHIGFYPHDRRVHDAVEAVARHHAGSVHRTFLHDDAGNGRVERDERRHLATLVQGGR